MAEAKKPARAATAVPKERTNFKALLAQNLNYFGNLEEKKLKPVKKIVFDTAFEQLTCVGFNPDGNLLEGDDRDQARHGLQRRPLHQGERRIRSLLHRLRVRLAGRGAHGRERARHPRREGLRRTAREAAHLRRGVAPRPQAELLHTSRVAARTRDPLVAVGPAGRQSELAPGLGQRPRVRDPDQTSPVEHLLPASRRSAP